MVALTLLRLVRTYIYLYGNETTDGLDLKLYNVMRGYMVKVILGIVDATIYTTIVLTALLAIVVSYI